MVQFVVDEEVDEVFSTTKTEETVRLVSALTCPPLVSSDVTPSVFCVQEVYT